LCLRRVGKLVYLISHNINWYLIFHLIRFKY
jgi:hypothetical protein